MYVLQVVGPEGGIAPKFWQDAEELFLRTIGRESGDDLLVMVHRPSCSLFRGGEDCDCDVDERLVRNKKWEMN